MRSTVVTGGSTVVVVLHEAVLEATQLGHSWVGDEHFLLALLATRSVASEVLEELGVTRGQITTSLERWAEYQAQFPEAEKIFTDASRQAPPIAQQIQQLRIRLVNAEIDKNDADIKSTLSDYRAAAARMAELEAQTFAKVYALLKPNQTKNATEAFAMIAGVFLPPPPASARVPQR